MASDLIPNFEVKLLLKPSEVLKSDDKLKDKVKSTFSITSDTKKMAVQFVDTKNQDFYNSGWNLRIRKTENKKNFELTYKKRYQIAEGITTTAGGNIDAAARTAGQEGFDSTTPYAAQIEMGYQKQTLSISHDEKIPSKDTHAMDLPLAEDSRGFLVDRAPNTEKLKSLFTAYWGTTQIGNSKIYGPVHVKRYTGALDGLEVSIEVWPIRKSKEDASLESIVEASFKADDLKGALEGKAKLQKALGDEDWFLPGDSLKTKLVMDRY